MGYLLAASSFIKWSLTAKITLLAVASAALIVVIITIIVVLCTRHRRNAVLLSAAQAEKKEENVAPKQTDVPVQTKPKYRRFRFMPVYVPVPMTMSAIAAPCAQYSDLSSELYNAVKAELLSYAGVCAIEEIGVERFACDDKTVATLMTYQNAVYLYLPPISKPDKKSGLFEIPQASGRFAKTPLFLLLREKGQLTFAKELIKLAAKNCGIERTVN